MTKKLILKLFIFLLLCNFSINNALAQTTGHTTTEQFLNSLLVDRPLFPSSTVSCEASGSLEKLLDRMVRFNSQGNAFFVSTQERKMAVFQTASGSSQNRTTVVNIFIKASGVTKENLQDLIMKRKLVITNNAQVIFVVYITENNRTATYLYDGTIEDATLFTRFSHVGNITSDGKKYIVANGEIKINFPRPPVYLDNGNPVEIWSGEGSVTCRFQKLPLDDDFLPGVEAAFDGTLVNDIKTEAGLPPSVP